MFEGIKIIKAIRKLVKDSSGIPGSLVTESEHLAKHFPINFIGEYWGSSLHIAQIYKITIRMSNV